MKTDGEDGRHSRPLGVPEGPSAREPVRESPDPRANGARDGVVGSPSPTSLSDEVGWVFGVHRGGSSSVSLDKI